MKIAYLSVIGWNTLILATLPLSLKLYNLSEETDVYKRQVLIHPGNDLLISCQRKGGGNLVAVVIRGFHTDDRLY